MYRETFALIDLAALTQNVKALHDQLADHVQLMATVKADAYGHGVIPVSKTILAAGADQLGVATVEEAIELREAGIQAPILVYGAMPHKAAKEIIHHDLMQTVFTDEDCDALQKAAMTLG
nr:alanine racemase [Bacilli bacterium]